MLELRRRELAGRDPSGAFLFLFAFSSDLPGRSILANPDRRDSKIRGKGAPTSGAIGVRQSRQRTLLIEFFTVSCFVFMMFETAV